MILTSFSRFFCIPFSISSALQHCLYLSVSVPLSFSVLSFLFLLYLLSLSVSLLTSFLNGRPNGLLSYGQRAPSCLSTVQLLEQCHVVWSVNVTANLMTSTLQPNLQTPQNKDKYLIIPKTVQFFNTKPEIINHFPFMNNIFSQSYTATENSSFKGQCFVTTTTS